MVHPGRDPRTFERAVLVCGPQCSPLLHKPVAVPLAGLHPAQAVGRCLPEGQENMRMMVVGVVSLVDHRGVDSHIGHHATADKDLLDEA